MRICLDAARVLRLQAAATAACAHAHPSMTWWAIPSSSSSHCRATTSPTNANRAAAAMASFWVAVVTAEMSASSLNPAIPARSKTSNMCSILLAPTDAGKRDFRGCG